MDYKYFERDNIIKINFRSNRSVPHFKLMSKILKLTEFNSIHVIMLTASAVSIVIVVEPTKNVEKLISELNKIGDTHASNNYLFLELHFHSDNSRILRYALDYYQVVALLGMCVDQEEYKISMIIEKSQGNCITNFLKEKLLNSSANK